MEGRDRDELAAEVRRQRYRIDSLAEQLDSLRVLVTVWPAALLVLAVLVVPLFQASTGDAGTARETIGLATLVDRAADADNGAVRNAALVLAIALGLTLVSSVAVGVGRDPRVAIAGIVLAASVIVVWLALTLAVAQSGDGGAVDDLGYSNTARTLLVPIAAAVSIVAFRVARDPG